MNQPKSCSHNQAYRIGSLESRAAARRLLESRKNDLSRLTDENLIHGMAKLAASVIGGGSVLIRSDFLGFDELPERFTPADWGYIEAMALRRNLVTYGPGEELEAVEVLAASIVPKRVIHVLHNQA